MILPLVALVVPVDPAAVPPPPPPAPAVIAAPAPPTPTHDGMPMPQVDTTPVQFTTRDGHVVTTGKAEAEVAAQPITDPAAYYYGLCLQLQEAKPWIDWACVKP